jgi:hypothetical protein
MSAEDLREPLLGRQPVTGPQVLPRYVLQEPLGDQFVTRAVPLSLIAVLAFIVVGCVARHGGSLHREMIWK